MRAFEVVTKFKEQNPTIPKRATEGSAGYDLASIEDIVIQPGEIKLVSTGLKARMPKTEALFVFPRSSLAIKKGLMMSNSVGVIDADYYNNPDNEGHIMIPLMNIKSVPVTLLKGERVAQGIFLQYQQTEDDLPIQSSRIGGFGSSGH
jgi:dUTP pyrophosphatase